MSTNQEESVMNEETAPKKGFRFAAPRPGEPTMDYVRRACGLVAERRSALAVAMDNTVRRIQDRMDYPGFRAHSVPPVQLHQVRDNGKYRSDLVARRFVDALEQRFRAALGGVRPRDQWLHDDRAEWLPKESFEAHALSALGAPNVVCTFKVRDGYNRAKKFLLTACVNDNGEAYGNLRAIRLDTVATPSPENGPSARFRYAQMLSSGYAKQTALEAVRFEYKNRPRRKRLVDGDVLVGAGKHSFMQALYASQERSRAIFHRGELISLDMQRQLGGVPRLQSIRVLWRSPRLAAGLSNEQVQLAIARKMLEFFPLSISLDAELFGPEGSAFRNKLLPNGVVQVYDTYADCFVSRLSMQDVHTCAITGRYFVGHGYTLLSGGVSNPVLLDEFVSGWRSTYRSAGRDGVDYLLREGESLPRRTHLIGYHGGDRSHHVVPFNEPRIGVELEVCCDTSDPGSRIAFLNEWQERDGFLLERDGSLSDEFGIEIVGPPLRREDYTEDSAWHRLTQWLRDNDARSWYAAGDYGMHVNLSRRYMSVAEQTAVVLATHRWSALMTSIGGRRTHFAEFDTSLSPEVSFDIARVRASRQLSGSGKYYAVHVKRNVLEFRLFRGTLAWSGFMRNIETVWALHDYAKEKCGEFGTVHAEDWTDHTQFVRWVDAEKYPHLHAFLVAKNWIGESPILRDTNFTHPVALMAA